MKNLIDNLKQQLPHGDAPADHCVECGESFSNKNVFTDAGWKETRISQMCEVCFDKLFEALQ
jgi:hypothetical protein